jgi:hypothetical protein
MGQEFSFYGGEQGAGGGGIIATVPRTVPPPAKYRYCPIALLLCIAGVEPLTSAVVVPPHHHPPPTTTTTTLIGSRSRWARSAFRPPSSARSSTTSPRSSRVRLSGRHHRRPHAPALTHRRACAVCGVCVTDDNYHMTGKNCNSFSDALCVALLDKYPTTQPNPNRAHVGGDHLSRSDLCG